MSVITVKETRDSGNVVGMVEISEAAAVRTGKSRHGAFLVEIDPALLSTEEREAFLSTPRREWNASKSRYWSYGDSGSGDTKIYLHCLTSGPTPDVPDCSEESIHLLLQWHAQAAAREAEYQAAKKLERQSELDRTVESWLAKDAHEFTQELCRSYRQLYDTVGLRSCTIDGVDVFADPRLADKILQVRALIEHENEKRRLAYEASEARKAEAERQKAEQEAKFEAERQAQVDEWVKLHGDESQRKRHACGLLPIKEVEDALRETAFEPLNHRIHVNRYEKIQNKDVCTCDYATCHVEFEVEDATEATAQEFAMLEQIQHLMPNATVQLRTHKAHAEDCDEHMERKSIRVEVEVGTFTFSREYAAQ